MAGLEAVGAAAGEGSHEDVVLEKKKENKEGGGPGNMITQPDKKIVYNAPFSETQTYNIILRYYGYKKVAWRRITRELNNRLFLRQVVEPSCGILEDKQWVMLKVTCFQFELEVEDEEEPEQISFEWTTIPSSAGQEFKHEILDNSSAKKRKDLPIHFNK